MRRPPPSPFAQATAVLGEALGEHANAAALTVALAHVAAARGMAPADRVAALGGPGVTGATGPTAAQGAARAAEAARALRSLAQALPRVGGWSPDTIRDDDGVAIAAVARALDPGAVAEAAARPERIGRFYEELLATSPGARKGAGSFYTHPQLADPTVRRALLPLAPPGAPPSVPLGLRVLDPSMGTGSLLLPAWRWLVDAAVAAGDPREGAGRAAVACLHGVDRDPLAVDLCRAALWLAVGDPAAPTGVPDATLLVGDSLIGVWPGQDLRWPAGALRRDAGDRDHDGVHRLAGERSAALARARRRAPRAGAPLDPDAWCALWMWPARGAETLAPPSHRDTGARDVATEAPPPDAVAAVAAAHRFLHWAAAFPAAVAAGGFDAVVGNPPWEALKPSSRAFFAPWDPEHGRRSRRAALAQRRVLFEDPAVEDAWLDEREHHRALAAWFRGVAATRPAGAPFRLQGTGDVNAYKLFTELSLALLRPGGRLGLLLPAAIYTDRGAAPLRAHLLERCTWEWLFAFENRARAFSIDARYKYCVVVAAKGGTTRAVRAAFMRRDPADWERAEELAVPVPADRLVAGRGPAVAELTDDDRALLDRLQAAGAPLGGEGAPPWGLRWATELHTTAHAAQFPPRPDWEARGYRPTTLGPWVRGGWTTSPRATDPGSLSGLDGASIALDAVDGVALPLWEGRMIGPLCPSAKGWVAGRGRTARWRDLAPGDGRLEPQYLITAEDAARLPPGPRVAYGRVTSSTNTRTVAAALLTLGASADSVFVLRPTDGSLDRALRAAGVLGSLVFDAQMRRRLGGLNLSRFVMVEGAMPRPAALPRGFPVLVARLALTHPSYAPAWLALEAEDPTGLLAARPGPLAWATTRADRLRLGALLDALVAHAWGLSARDLAALLADCTTPEDAPPHRLRELPPRGHWRIDRRSPPALRATVLAVAALRDLEREGPDALLARDGGDGWPLPETLDLRALGLPAEPGLHPVRSRVPPEAPPAHAATAALVRATLAEQSAQLAALLGR